MGSEKVAILENRKPGITTTIKTMMSFEPSDSNALLAVGWGNSQQNQQIFDPTSGLFSGKLPLKYLMGFAEDYPKGIQNAKQELILTLAHSFANSYIGEVGAVLNITKIKWEIKHIVPEDRLKFKLLNRINKGGINAKVKMG